MQPWLIKEQKRDIHIKVPQFGEDRKLMRKEEPVKRIVNEEGFLEILWEISELHPHLSSWEVVQLYWKDVCCTAFADEVMSRIIAGEKMITDYQGAIGNLFEEDVRVGLFGFDLGYEGTLEAMEITRSAKRAYERYEMEEMEKKAEANRAGQGNKPQLVRGA